VNDPTLTVLALLGLAALVAGYVDAVVGGGGLVQLPALLLGLPGASPVQILATNKLASFCGTTVSSATYYRRIRPDPRTFLPLMLLAFLGAATGAGIAFLIPRSAFDPIVLVVLVAVGAYVLLKPEIGGTTALRFAGRRHTAAAMGTGFAIGQLGHQPGRPGHLRAAGGDAVEGRAGPGCRQPRRRLPRRPYGGRPRRRLRARVLHRGRVLLRGPDRRRAGGPVVSSCRTIARDGESGTPGAPGR
jgi:hypothetical protein